MDNMHFPIDGYEFEMEASEVPENKSLSPQSKNFSIIFITNISKQLEYFTSLFEIQNSPLYNNILKPEKIKQSRNETHNVILLIPKKKIEMLAYQFNNLMKFISDFQSR